MTNSTLVQDGNSRGADKFAVRLPDGMRARISVLARARRQSMNSYIIYSMENALRADEEANGTYVAPGVEEVVPAQMVAVRPQFVVNMACRYNGKPKIIREFDFDTSEELILALIDMGDDHQAWVPLEDLEPY